MLLVRGQGDEFNKLMNSYGNNVSPDQMGERVATLAQNEIIGTGGYLTKGIQPIKRPLRTWTDDINKYAPLTALNKL